MSGNISVVLIVFLLVLIPMSFVAGTVIVAVMTDFDWLSFLLFFGSLYATYRVTSIKISKWKEN